MRLCDRHIPFDVFEFQLFKGCRVFFLPDNRGNVVKHVGTDSQKNRNDNNVPVLLAVEPF